MLSPDIAGLEVDLAHDYSTVGVTAAAFWNLDSDPDLLRIAEYHRVVGRTRGVEGGHRGHDELSHSATIKVEDDHFQVQRHTTTPREWAHQVLGGQSARHQAKKKQGTQWFRCASHQHWNAQEAARCPAYPIVIHSLTWIYIQLSLSVRSYLLQKRPKRKVPDEFCDNKTGRIQYKQGFKWKTYLIVKSTPFSHYSSLLISSAFTAWLLARLRVVVDFPQESRSICSAARWAYCIALRFAQAAAWSWPWGTPSVRPNHQ